MGLVEMWGNISDLRAQVVVLLHFKIRIRFVRSWLQDSGWPMYQNPCEFWARYEDAEYSWVLKCVLSWMTGSHGNNDEYLNIVYQYFIVKNPSQVKWLVSVSKTWFDGDVGSKVSKVNQVRGFKNGRAEWQDRVDPNQLFRATLQAVQSFKNMSPFPWKRKCIFATNPDFLTDRRIALWKKTSEAKPCEHFIQERY